MPALLLQLDRRHSQVNPEAPVPLSVAHTAGNTLVANEAGGKHHHLSYPLTATCVLWQMCTCTYTLENAHVL